MPQQIDVMPYDQVAAEIGDGRTNHLLLGNGFSIACNPIFRYDRLYDAAVAAGLSPRAQSVFERIGTNNFEAVMRLLDDGHWLARNYELIPGPGSAMLEDLEVVKNTLVEAVSTSHLDNAALVPDEQKRSALRFLEPYKNVFSTNYDLLLYWVNMASGGEEERPRYEDGFRADPDDPEAETLVFSERPGDRPAIYFIHGALHLFTGGSGVRKHSWVRSGRPLTTLIREGLVAKRYPLFVAEGTWQQKLAQIRRSSYLSYCYDKLGRVTGRIVVFGLAFGENDLHLQHVIADNRSIEKMYVSLHGDPMSGPNLAIRAATEAMRARRATRRRARPLEVVFFDAASARVWDRPVAAVAA